MRLEDWPERLWLLARDYCSELPAIWAVVRSGDCERWGGHYWGSARQDEVLGFGRTCSGCGTFEVLPPSAGTSWTTMSSVNPISYRITP